MALLDVVGHHVDSRCHRMPVVTEHHPGVHMPKEIRQQLRSYADSREDRNRGVMGVIPGCPGPEVFPPQQMVFQIRTVIEGTPPTVVRPE